LIFFWNAFRKMLTKTRLTVFESSKDDCFLWAEKSANDSLGQEPDLIWIGAKFEGEVSTNDGLSHEKLLLLLCKLLLLLLKLLLKFGDNCCLRLGFDEVNRFMKFDFSLGLVSFLSVGGLWEVGVNEDITETLGGVMAVAADRIDVFAIDIVFLVAATFGWCHWVLKY
jgi:hypothetical protein